MKKKLITLIICGVIGGTSVAGFAANTMSDGTNDQQTLVSAIDDADKKETVNEEAGKNGEEGTGNNDKADSEKVDESASQNKSVQAASGSKQRAVSTGETTTNSTNGGAKVQSNDGQGSMEAASKPLTDVSENTNTDCNTSNNGANNNSQNSGNTDSGNTNSGSNNIPSEDVTNGNFSDQVEQLIFNKVNEERAKAGVPALSYNSTMETYARIKSKDMGDKNYFDHKDLNGELITAQMARDGVSYSAWGENIAYIGGVSDAAALADQFMTNWMNSQGHRENILSTNFSSIGVGVYKSGNRYYATQEFYK